MSKKNKLKKTAAELTNKDTEINIGTSKTTLSYKTAFLISVSLLTLASFWVMKDFLLGSKLYLFKDIGSDSLNQIYPFAKMTMANIKSNGFPKWSFQQGLGQYIASFNAGNPFHWLIYLMGESSLPYSIGLIEFLKFIIAGLLFFAFLKEAKMSPLACILGAFVFGFSSFITLGSSWFNFLSGWAVEFAFWLFALEIFLRKGRWQYMPLAVALVAMDQPFNVFLFTEFSLIYIICWYFFVGKYRLKIYAFHILKLVGLGAIGLLLGSFMIGSSLFTIFNSPRLLGESTFMASLKGKPILQIVDGLQLGTAVTRFFGNNILGFSSGYKGWNNYFEAPNFYLGIISLALFPQAYFFIKRENIKPGIFLTLGIILFIIFPFFRFAIWGFTGDYYRITSLFISLAMLMATLYVITLLQEGYKLNLIVLGGSFVFWLVLLNLDYSDNWSNIVIGSEKIKALFLLTLIAIGIVIYSFSKSGILLYFLIGISCFEVLYNANSSIVKRDAISKIEWNEKVGFNDYSNDAIAFLKAKDQSFYRVEKDFSSGNSIHFSNNDPMVQGYNGTTVYTAFNHQSQVAYMAALDIIDPLKEDQTRWLNGLRDRPFLLGQLSVKYVLSKGRIDFKHFGYDSLNKVGDITIFQNPNALPMGYCLDTYMLQSDFEKLTGIDKDISLLKAFVIQDKEKESFKGFSKLNSQDDVINPETVKKYSDLRKQNVLSINKFTDNDFDGNISLKKPQLLLLSIPFDNGWKAFVNGKPTKIIKVNYGLSGINLSSGDFSIKLNYEHPYIDITKYTSFAGVGAYFALIVLGFLKKKKTLDLVEEASL